jgi:hypothetical protein
MDTSAKHNITGGKQDIKVHNIEEHLRVYSRTKISNSNLLCINLSVDLGTRSRNEERQSRVVYLL